jgi:hypothetical protein
VNPIKTETIIVVAYDDSALAIYSMVGTVSKRIINNENPPIIRNLKLNLLANFVAAKQPERTFVNVGMTTEEITYPHDQQNKNEHADNIWYHIRNGNVKLNVTTGK